MRHYELQVGNRPYATIVLGKNLEDAKKVVREKLGVKRLPVNVQVNTQIPQDKVEEFAYLVLTAFKMLSKKSKKAQRQGQIKLNIAKAFGTKIFKSAQKMQKELDNLHAYFYNLV